MYYLQLHLSIYKVLGVLIVKSVCLEFYRLAMIINYHDCDTSLYIILYIMYIILYLLYLVIFCYFNCGHSISTRVLLPMTLLHG